MADLAGGCAWGDGEAGPGLVSFSTSDKPLIAAAEPHRIVVDPQGSRLKKMRSGILTAAGLIVARLGASGQRWKPAMVDLTYADADAFDPRQLSGLMKHIREWAKRRGLPPLPYVWVLERGEKRGRLHYHLLIWLPKGVTLPKPDKQGWWPWGHTRIAWARRAVGYLAKYATKGPRDGSGPFFPKGARIHGKGGLTAVERSQCAWWRAPAWVKQAWPRWEDQPRPAPGGGWVSRVLGDWLPSPWKLVGFDLGRPVIEWDPARGLAILGRAPVSGVTACDSV